VVSSVQGPLINEDAVNKVFHVLAQEPNNTYLTPTQFSIGRAFSNFLFHYSVPSISVG